MPSQSYPQAQFVPVSPNLDLAALVDNTPNFDYVTRLSVEQLKEHTVQSFEELVLTLVIQNGKPLVVEDWQRALNPTFYSKHWLETNLGTKAEKVRDITNTTDIPMTIGHYLRSMAQLTNQFSPSNFRDPKQQRLYLKDINCPDPWADHLATIIPESVYYLNECIESRTGGDGAIREPNEYGQMSYSKGVAPAGDLMSSLPPEMRAQNMMCYIGHEGTYTPAHREMCASLGQNLMVETSQDSHGEKEGSSIWFMTETKEREVVSEYFLSILGHDIEVEKHFAQVNAWKKAPFNVWVVEQKVGDLILIPPLAPHQVWNRGTRTMKVAWNRTTIDTLELAIHEALPRARMVCRDEQYKNKAIIYYTLVKYHGLLQRDTIEPKMWKYGRIKQLLDDFRRLFLLYTEILVSEMFSPKLPEEADIEFLPYESNVTCSYCRCNIFNRFLTCKSCVEYGLDEEEDTYDICMDCYAMGRSCACVSNLTWVEQWNWKILLQNYEQWRNIVVQSDGFFDVQRSPQPLDIARKRYGKKPIAEVCQEQLNLRPWNDIKNPTIREPSLGMSDIEPEVDDDGRPKDKKRGKFSKNGKGRVVAVRNKTHACHICFHHDWNWRLAFCSTCTNAYCYGVLWRAFDLMPQAIMEDKDWQCPKCLKMCSCGRCRKSDSQTPYAPKGTLLGHDTRAVADFRSVESLVDFSKTNFTWLRGEDDNSPQDTVRMKKLKEKAEADKALDTVKENYIPKGAQDHFADDAPVGQDYIADNMEDIDPALRGTVDPTLTADSQTDGNYEGQYVPVVVEPKGDKPNHVNGNGGEPKQQEWPMDDHYDLANYYSYNHQGLNYPSKLLALDEIPMVAPELPMMIHAQESYPDPLHTDQTRMMGIGYYQQGNSIDKILYNPPSFDNLAAQPTHPGPSENSNMAFSDLLPNVEESTENGKKRKREEGEDDLEFFTSNRARELAKSRKTTTMREVPPIDSTERKPLRRSITQPKVYMDLGEDAVPIEDDEAPSSGSHNRKSDGDTGANATGKAIRRPIKPAKDKSQPLVKTSMRANQSAEASPAVSGKKSHRKSTWLARKEALENGKAFSKQENVSDSPRPKSGHGRPSKQKSHGSANTIGSSESTEEERVPDNPRSKRERGRPAKRKSHDPAGTIQLSGSEEDNEDGGVEIGNKDVEPESGSLFGDSVGNEGSADSVESIGPVYGGLTRKTVRAKTVKSIKSVYSKPVEQSASPMRSAYGGEEHHDSSGGIKRQTLKSNPSFQLGQLDGSADDPTPKRGPSRLRKHIALIRPASPEYVRSKAAPKMLSLKEKLTLQGKGAKVVAVKSKAGARVKTTLSITMPVLRNPSPLGSKKRNIRKNISSLSNTTNDSSATPSPTSLKPFDVEANTSESAPVQLASPMPAQSPGRKGPAVVRLVSSDSDSEEDISSHDHHHLTNKMEVGSGSELQGSLDGDSSDSDSDASIPAVQISLRQSRGGASLVSRGEISGRGRGRDRPSLRA